MEINIETDEQGNVVLFQKADGSSLGKEADAAEVELREGLVDFLREAGIEVVVDAAEAQRVLDAYRRTQTQSDNGNIKFFRTKKGEVYGFMLDGKIYIDPRIATSETPVHEYHHLWSEALERANPEAWARLKSELLGDEDLRELVDEVRRLYPELTDGNDLAHEVFSFYGGRRGAERLRKEQARMEAEAKGVTAKARIAVLFDKLRRLLSRYWQMSRDLFAGRNEKLKDLKVDDFADMAMADLLHKVDPRGLTPEPSPKGEGAKVADTFYSNAERAVEKVKQDKATAEQWKAMLTKSGGIKAGEDKWMGLTQWLDEHKGETLTKEQVLQFVRDNGVRMEETTYQEGGDYMLSDGLDRACEELENKIQAQGIDAVREQMPEFDDYFDYEFGHVYWTGDDLQASYDYAKSNGLLKDVSEPINSIRLDYTTEGLENKREIAFVVPGVEPYQKNDAVHFGPENEGRAVMWVRFGETTDKDGNRVLVIDEIQSNRHQDAREKGYKGHGPEYELLNKRRLDAMHAYYERAGEFVKEGGEFGKASEEDPLAKALWKQWGEDEQKLREYNKAHGFSDNSLIPAAPFEKNWHEVAMKRMLRLAAEEGFDKVAWTTGEQQATRYGIGNSVDRIVKTDDNTFEVYTKDGNPMMELEFDADGVYRDEDDAMLNDKSMSDIFGKELAQRLQAMSEGETLQEDGLRIGGEGMKGFYDQMLPRFMDKYGKKWGVKTGEVELSTPGGEVMHSVDVTDAMRESVLHEGQPLFQKAGEEDGRGIGIDDRVAQYEYLFSDNYVSSLTGNEFAKSDKPLTERVAQFYAEKHGGKVERDGVGTVLLDERSVKDSIAHGLGRNKAVAFAAVPNIIKSGAIIDRQENWKGRGHGSVTFAAPIEIAGKGYVGIVVANEVTLSDGSHRFYLHEVALQKSLLSEEFKTGIDTGSKHGDVAKVLKEIVNAKENGEKVADEGGGTLYRTSGELDREYPTWLSGQTEESGKHSTQIAGTVSSYHNIGRWLKENGMSDARVLDASSGLGLGTKALREQAKEIYENVLRGNFNDVTLQAISDYIANATPNNPYGRRVSERIPQRARRTVETAGGLAAVDALFSRICESAIRPHERTRSEGRRAIEARKKEALKQWAQATGNWYTDLSASLKSCEAGLRLPCVLFNIL